MVGLDRQRGAPVSFVDYRSVKMVRLVREVVVLVTVLVHLVGVPVVLIVNLWR